MKNVFNFTPYSFCSNLLAFPSLVLVAECMKHFFPKLVELHNYPAANSMDGKINNWKMLNR
jgi:hypothetical protein